VTDKASLDLTSTVIPTPGVYVTSIDGEKVLYVPEGGTLHHLNQPASLIWDCLLPAAPICEIVRDLSEILTVDQPVIEKDVLDVLGRLFADGALVVAPSDVGELPSIP
jgi:hypothetical protein